MSPVAPIVHLLALAVGIWGSLQLMDRVAPDLPISEPGVVEAGEGQVTGPGDDQSLLQPGPFSIALAQIREQLGADERIVSIVVTPGELSVDSSDSGEGVSIDDVATSAPYLLAYAIGEARKGKAGRSDVDGVDDLERLTFLATPDGGVWTATLRPGLRPPAAYQGAVPPGAVAFEVKVRPVPAP